MYSLFASPSDIHRQSEPRHTGAEVIQNSGDPLRQDLPGESHQRGPGPPTGAAGLRSGRWVSAESCCEMNLKTQVIIILKPQHVEFNAAKVHKAFWNFYSF